MPVYVHTEPGCQCQGGRSVQTTEPSLPPSLLWDRSRGKLPINRVPRFFSYLAIIMSTNQNYAGVTFMSKIINYSQRKDILHCPVINSINGLDFFFRCLASSCLK